MISYGGLDRVFLDGIKKGEKIWKTLLELLWDLWTTDFGSLNYGWVYVLYTRSKRFQKTGAYNAPLLFLTYFRKILLFLNELNY